MRQDNPIKKNYETQILINSISIDKIKKKI
jgi:hypothetical protein